MMNTGNDGFGVEVDSLTLATKVSYKSTEAVWQIVTTAAVMIFKGADT